MVNIKRFFILIFLLSVLVIALCFSPTSNAYIRYPQLDKIIKIVDHHGVAHCLDTNEHLGFDPGVGYDGRGAVTSVIRKNGEWIRPGGYIVFGPGVCVNLVNTIADPDLWTNDYYINATAQQFLLFTHEMGHMTGMRNWKSEAFVGCWGIQHVYGVMLLMGLPVNYASLLFLHAVKEYGLWPFQYHLENCIVASPITINVEING